MKTDQQILTSIVETGQYDKETKEYFKSNLGHYAEAYLVAEENRKEVRAQIMEVKKKDQNPAANLNSNPDQNQEG